MEPGSDHLFAALYHELHRLAEHHLRRGGSEISLSATTLLHEAYLGFAERGELHVLNGQMYLHGTDPFELFAEMQRRDPKLDPSHAFYLGYELAKAVTALTLGKSYTQDQALSWGFLTVPEVSHRS